MKRKILIAVGIFIMIAGMLLGIQGIYKNMAEENAGEIYEDLKVEFDIEPILDIPQLEAGQVDVPIDFASLPLQILPPPTTILP